MTVSDIEILEMFRKDREIGIKVLFDRFYRPLVLYADDFMDSMAVSEDIVQEFFVRLWEDDYLCTVAPKALSSYLFTSVRNACYTHERCKETRIGKVGLSGFDVPADCAAEMSRQIVERVTEAINKLPAQTSAVVMRVLMLDMKYQEAADELNISLNTVKTLLRNGLKMLREELKDDRSLLLFIFSQKKF